MQDKPITKGHSLSFLQRFEGRKAAISKEGLLHLFDIRLGKDSIVARSNSLPHKQSLISGEIVTKHNLQDRARDIIRSGSDFRGAEKENPASRISSRTDILKKNNAEEQIEDLILPKLTARFSSSSSHNEPSSSPIRKSRKNVGASTKEEEPRKIGFALRNMDRDVHEHFEFLSRLEEKWAHLKNKK